MPLVLALQTAPASTAAQNIVSTVNRFTDFLLAYVAALAAVGALSMALIEAGKKLLDQRTRFQTLRWTEWMQISPFTDASSGEAGEINRVTAYAELLRLCTGVPEAVAAEAADRLFRRRGHLPINHSFVRFDYPAHAVFALDLEHMLGSIQEAADVALAAPQQTPSLYMLMTSGADPEDVLEWYSKGSESMVATASTDDRAREHIKAQADRLARLRQIVKRKIDGFQVYVGDRWASWNQTVANFVGIAVLFVVLLWIKHETPQGAPSYPMIVLLSAFGGILSPIAKDLLTTLKRVKDG
jgi:hypothetical protein